MKHFSTTDIVLAASLKLHGFNLINIELQGNKGVFKFESDDSVTDFLSNFDLGKVAVEPVSFNYTIKQLTTSVRRMV